MYDIRINNVGIDIEEVGTFKKELNNELFLCKIFSNQEIKYCKSKMEPHLSFAGKFCAKEAVIKSLNKKIEMKSIEILNNRNGQPEVYINGKKEKKIKCSISHSNTYAIAIAIILV